MSQPPYPQQPGQQYPQFPGQQSPGQPYQQVPGQPYPPQEPVKAKKKWFKRPWVWILAVIVVIAIASNGGGGDKQSSAPAEPATAVSSAPAAAPATQAAAKAPQAAKETQAAQAETRAGLNQAVGAGDLQYTVTKVQKGVSKVGDQYLNQTAQGQYVLVNVSVKNTGTSAMTFTSDYTKLYDKNKVEYSSDSTAEIYANSQSQTFLEQVNPGNTVKGILVFDIPKDVQPTTLGVKGGMFGSEKLIALS